MGLRLDTEVKKLKRAKELWPDLAISVNAIAKELDVSKRTLYRHMPKRRDT